MDWRTFVIIVVAVDFGFLLGAWWATRRREEYLKANQPLDGARWGQPETYDRYAERFRAAEGQH